MRVRKLGHVALYAEDVPRMTEFYRDLFDLTVSAQDKTGSITFLGVNPHANHHDLAFVSNRGVAHVCFYVDSLSEFRAFYAGLKSRNIPVLNCQMVMMGLRMDFHDPEGNLAEIVWPHGKWGRFPFFRKVDLDMMTDEYILQMIDEIPLEEHSTSVFIRRDGNYAARTK